MISIAIDGPSGAGKSTLARRLAKELGYVYVDTGAMYRTMALHFIRLGISPGDEEAIARACRDVDVTICYKDGAQQVMLNGENVTGLIRTAGPVVTLNGAWAQNIGEEEMFIDFMGDKGGIRLQYGKEFTVYTTENNALISYTPVFPTKDHFQQEIDAFIRCIQTGEKLPSHIDTAVITSRIMQALYDSADQHRELVLD